MTIPGIDVDDRGDAGRRDRRRPPLPDLAPPGRLPRPASDASASPATGRRATAACPRRARPPPATCSSRRRGRRPRAPGRCARSPSAPPRAAAATSPTVAVARKLAVLAWHLLTRGEDYAFARPALVRRKLRRLELTAGAPRRQARPERRPDLATHGHRRAPNAARRSRPRPPTGAWSPTGRPAGPRWVRARHRSAHLRGPRRARPRGRPQAPDACTSPRQSPAPTASIPKEPERASQV